MKTIAKLIVAAAMLTVATNANAQTEWKNPSPVGISYGTQTLKEDATGLEYKSGFSIGIFKRKSFNLHKYPIADVLMFGLDVNWFEMNVARYAKGKGVSLGSLTGSISKGTYDSFDDYFNDAYESAPDRDGSTGASELLKRLDLGKYQVMVHLLGVGPSVHWAPFGAGTNSFLEKIKLTGYFHYLPTATGLVFTGNGDDGNVVSAGYMSCWRGGGTLQYGRFGIGVEQTWGSGNLKQWNIGSNDEDEAESIGFSKGEKMKYSMKGLRFYVGIRF